MFRRILRRVLIIAAPVLLLPLLVASPARADTRDCWTGFNTGYGEIMVCTLYRNNDGRAALYSPLTRQYTYQSGWLEAGPEQYNAGSVRATDGYVGYFFGGARLATAYGDASWGVQYRGTDYSAPKGRFGWYNFVTRQFYPSSGWLNRP